MRSSRRIQRLSRYRPQTEKMSLTSLMDVFTILVFFLLVNSGNSEVLQQPKQIALPDSVVENRPRESSVVILVGKEEVLVQGDPVVRIADIVALEGEDIEPIRLRLAALSQSVIGVRTQAAAESQEVTVMADKSVPFEVLKKVMSTCTNQGYTRVSLAVVQKASQLST